MTVHQDTGAPSAGTSDEQSRSARVAGQATSEASNVASTGADAARDVASEASTQVKAVAGEAKQQVDRLVNQARDEFRQQAQNRNDQAAGGLRTLSEQLTALADGRTESAGPLVGYLQDAEGQVRRLAWRLEQGGPQGVMDDVTRFARRRPGLFLAGAAGIGFLAGRALRAGIASNQDSSETSTMMSPRSYDTSYDTVPSTYTSGDPLTPLAGDGPTYAEAVTETTIVDPTGTTPAETLPPPTTPETGLRP